jgi:hypothetical protein
VDRQPTVGNPLAILPKDNIAPRLGFAWAPFGNNKTSVRGGFGMFHPMFFRVYWNVNRNLAPFVQNITAEAPTLSFPYPLEGITRNPTPTGDSFVYEPDQPTVAQYNLTIQRELRPSTVLTVGYVGSHGYNSPRYIDSNIAPATILPDGRKFFPAGGVRQNPAWAVFRYKVTDSVSDYNAMQLKLTQRFRQGLQFQGSYTWSHSIDIASEHGSGHLENNSVPQDAFDRDSERGSSGYDVRHLATINFSYELPGASKGPLLSGWQLAGIVTLSSGLPFTAVNSFDRDRDADVGQSRPDLVPGRSSNPVLGGPDRYFDPTAFRLQEAGFYGNLGRNTIIGPGLATLDMALTKNTSLGSRFNLQIRAEAFNLLNRANFGLPARTVFRSANGIPAADAGRITTTATSARQGQVGIKISF